MTTKELETECFVPLTQIFDDSIPFVNDTFEYVGDDEDLEKMEEDTFPQNLDDTEVDVDFLSKINKTVVESIEAKPKRKDYEGGHPMDVYLRCLILDVMVKEFLPILQKQLLVTQITKKEDK